MTNGDNIQLGPLANKTRTEARKIAVFNLTTTKYKNGGENNYEDLSQIKKWRIREISESSRGIFSVDFKCSSSQGISSNKTSEWIFFNG